LAIFWYVAGVLSTLAVLAVALPWLRAKQGGSSLAPPWRLIAGAGAVIVAAMLMYRWLGHPELAVSSPASAPVKEAMAAMSPTTKANAGSMSSAIASLEARLAKGGGSAGDWDLLAKSYEFLGRPEDAAQARAHKLPPVPAEEAGTSVAAKAPGASVSGEISLDPALKAKATPGATLFILAKSVDSPGAPVAVIRSSVGSWPLKFSLDDSHSMVPGHNLSSAGRVIVEARISKSGQPLPSAGDLQGTTGPINPADHQSLKIVIDKVIN